MCLPEIHRSGHPVHGPTLPPAPTGKDLPDTVWQILNRMSRKRFRQEVPGD